MAFQSLALAVVGIWKVKQQVEAFSLSFSLSLPPPPFPCSPSSYHCVFHINKINSFLKEYKHIFLVSNPTPISVLGNLFGSAHSRRLCKKTILTYYGKSKETIGERQSKEIGKITGPRSFIAKPLKPSLALLSGHIIPFQLCGDCPLGKWRCEYPH